MMRVEHNSANVIRTITGLRDRMAVSTSPVVDKVDVFGLSAVSVRALEDRLAAIRRRRSDVNEALALENMKVKINLPDSVVKTLTQHGIIT
jgi:hypothetical protein